MDSTQRHNEGVHIFTLVLQFILALVNACRRSNTPPTNDDTNHDE